jgi:hypothetical protein
MMFVIITPPFGNESKCCPSLGKQSRHFLFPVLPRGPWFIQSGPVRAYGESAERLPLAWACGASAERSPLALAYGAYWCGSELRSNAALVRRASSRPLARERNLSAGALGDGSSWHLSSVMRIQKANLINHLRDPGLAVQPITRSAPRF